MCPLHLLSVSLSLSMPTTLPITPRPGARPKHEPLPCEPCATHHPAASPAQGPLLYSLPTCPPRLNSSTASCGGCHGAPCLGSGSADALHASYVPSSQYSPQRIVITSFHTTEEHVLVTSRGLGAGGSLAYSSNLSSTCSVYPDKLPNCWVPVAYFVKIGLMIITEDVRIKHRNT